MLANYLKIALKVLGRRKFFTFISLFGISFTLMVLMVATAFVDSALAPGTPETRLARTLHIHRMEMKGERYTINSEPGYAFLDRYIRDIPGVELAAIRSTPSQVTSFVRGEKLTFMMARTDGNFWKIFDFDFISGGPFTVDDDRGGIPVAIISRATRQRYFGDQSALDQVINLDGQTFRVIGVVENVPITRAAAAADVWTPIGASKSRESLDQYMGDFFGLLLAESPADFPRIKAEFWSRLEHVELPDQERFEYMRGSPLTRFEMLASEACSSNERLEPRLHQMFILVIAAVIAFLLLPTINMININMSRILERASEIGVRKAFGASGAHLVGQFMFENILLCLLGGIVALIAAGGVLAWINTSGIIPNAGFGLNYRVFFYGLGLATFFGLLSGVYPAWRMSRLHPVEALRGASR